MASTIRITLVTGVIASTEKQKQTVLGLGLKHRHAVSELNDTPAIRGMINKVQHLVKFVDETSKVNVLPSLPPEYELGSVRARPVVEKKKAVKKVAETSTEATIKATKSAKSVKAKAAGSKTASKKVKGK